MVINTNSFLTISDVANYFLSKSTMTHKKLQKIVYFAYAKYIFDNNNDENKIENVLFSEVPEAWIHGPVFPSLYQRYKNYNWKPIPKYEGIISINKDICNFLDHIYSSYSCYSADDLEYMTHQEYAWKNARNGLDSSVGSNIKISLRDIYLSQK